MREVGILEAKTKLSALVEAVDRDGEEVMITRHGRAVAKLTSPDAPGARRSRRFSGPELLAKSLALQARISKSHPDSESLTWEELKEDMRR
ncbi:MAG TPA: type II toxin-antitoxin system Phd/YefM family antitoxin [Caulobacter sp.]|nr:type II toxin-antitoxin system Phd/YefM family antitoxin [Caulobacter sp.]